MLPNLSKDCFLFRCYGGNHKVFQDDRTGQLEADIELHRKIVAAAERLAKDKTTNKSVRKKRRKDWQAASQRLRGLEKGLYKMRISNSKPDVSLHFDNTSMSNCNAGSGFSLNNLSTYLIRIYCVYSFADIFIVGFGVKNIICMVFSGFHALNAIFCCFCFRNMAQHCVFTEEFCEIMSFDSSWFRSGLIGRRGRQKSGSNNARLTTSTVSFFTILKAEISQNILYKYLTF